MGTVIAMQPKLEIVSSAPPAPETKVSADAAATAPATMPAPLVSRAANSRMVEHGRAFLRFMIPPLLGLALFIGIWAVVSHSSPQLPGPVKTWESAVTLFSHPFYRNGPNDQGIGWNILN